jgi:hypothetical protein
VSRKVGQIIARGERRWLVGVYLGRDRETRRRYEKLERLVSDDVSDVSDAELEKLLDGMYREANPDADEEEGE